jgi:hypothetical protein
MLWHYRHGFGSSPPPPGPNASTEDTARRDESGDAALGHPTAIAKRLRRLAGAGGG